MDYLKCIFVIIGAIIGAGFASGKEIHTFFFCYGNIGVLGLIFAILLIGIIIYKTLKIIKDKDINSYEKFIKVIVPIKTKNIDLSIIIKNIVNIFLLMTFYIMSAGGTAYFYQEFGINKILSGIVISVICYMILKKDTKGIFLINEILVPIMVIFIIILGFKSMGHLNFKGEIQKSDWMIKSILYASYNSITLVTILISLKEYIKTKKDIIKISSITTVIIIILGIAIMMILNTIQIDIKKIDIPTVYASRTIWKFL